MMLIQRYFSISCIVWCLITINSYGHTIVVDQAGRNKSIKRAIASAQSGDTIRIKSGKYSEGNIVLEKSLVILGENYPVLDGDHKYEIFTIHAHHVTIQGLTFINTGVASINDLAAIKVLDSKYLYIRNNCLVNTFFGIHLSNSSQVWIENNELHSDAKTEHQVCNGIHLWKCMVYILNLLPIH